MKKFKSLLVIFFIVTISPCLKAQPPVFTISPTNATQGDSVILSVICSTCAQSNNWFDAKLVYDNSGFVINLQHLPPPMPFVSFQDTGYYILVIPDSAPVGNYSLRIDIFIFPGGGPWISIQYPNSFTVSIPTEINNLELNNYSSYIFPNPFNSNAYLSLNTLRPGLKLNVYDEVGRKIITQKIVSDKTVLSKQDFQKGIYVYQLLNESGIIISKGKFIVD